MNNYKLILKLLTVLTLTTLVLTFNNCSGDSPTTNSCNTFLECYGGTAWHYYNNFQSRIVMIQNNKNNPIDYYKFNFENSCYDCISTRDVDFQILSNTKTVLRVHLDYGDGTVEDVDIKESSMGNLIFEFPTNDLEDLSLCN